MTLREFVKMVSSTHGVYTKIAISRQSGKGFSGRSGDTWIDSILGFSFCAREEYGDDWGLGKVPVIGLEIIETHNDNILCAIIE